MKNFKRFLPFAILILFVALIALAVLRLEEKQNLNVNQVSNNFEAKLLENKIQLPEFSLPELYDSDKNLSLNDLINNEKKYSIINFFASWCSTCAAEHEILMLLKQENIVDIYGIAWHDFSENTIKFLKKNGNPFKKIALDSQGLFTKIINIRAVPETIVVDHYGKVIMRFQGNLTTKNIEEIKKIISK